MLRPKPRLRCSADRRLPACCYTRSAVSSVSPPGSSCSAVSREGLYRSLEKFGRKLKSPIVVLFKHELCHLLQFGGDSWSLFQSLLQDSFKFLNTLDEIFRK